MAKIASGKLVLFASGNYAIYSWSTYQEGPFSIANLVYLRYLNHTQLFFWAFTCNPTDQLRGTCQPSRMEEYLDMFTFELSEAWGFRWQAKGIRPKVVEMPSLNYFGPSFILWQVLQFQWLPCCQCWTGHPNEPMSQRMLFGLVAWRGSVHSFWHYQEPSPHNVQNHSNHAWAFSWLLPNLPSPGWKSLETYPDMTEIANPPWLKLAILETSE